MKDAVILPSGKVGCGYGACRGKLGEIIHAIRPYGGRKEPSEGREVYSLVFGAPVWCGLPDPITDDHIIVLWLPLGYYEDEAGVWCRSDGARSRMGLGKQRGNPHDSARYERRYRPGEPAQTYNTHDAPQIHIAITGSEIGAGISWLFRKSFGSDWRPATPMDPIETPRDIPDFRAQALLPALVECPDCHNVCRVALATA